MQKTIRLSDISYNVDDYNTLHIYVREAEVATISDVKKNKADDMAEEVLHDLGYIIVEEEIDYFCSLEAEWTVTYSNGVVKHHCRSYLIDEGEDIEDYVYSFKKNFCRILENDRLADIGPNYGNISMEIDHLMLYQHDSYGDVTLLDNEPETLHFE